MIELFHQWLCGLMGHKPGRIGDGRFECIHCGIEMRDPDA